MAQEILVTDSDDVFLVRTSAGYRVFEMRRHNPICTCEKMIVTVLRADESGPDSDEHTSTSTWRNKKQKRSIKDRCGREEKKHTMKSRRVLLCLVLVASANAYSLHDAQKFSQKSVMSSFPNERMATTTRREPIRMPSQTPMVPYMVRNQQQQQLACYTQTC